MQWKLQELIVSLTKKERQKYNILKGVNQSLTLVFMSPLTRFERMKVLARASSSSAYATDHMIEIQCLTAMASFVNTFRVQVEEQPCRFTFPSIVSIIEAPSGAGKNTIINFLNDLLLKDSFNDLVNYWEGQQVELLKDYLIDQKELIKKDLEDDPDVKDEDIEGKLYKLLKKAKIHWYEHVKRTLTVLTETKGSLHGFAFGRAYMMQMLIGAPIVIVEEYENKIGQMNNASYLKSMYDTFVDLVDTDKLGGSVIKDRSGGTPPSEGIGITCLFTLSNLDSKKREQIEEAILSAIGRRGFICFETVDNLNHDFARGHIDDLYSFDEVENFSYEIKELFDSVLERVKESKNKGSKYLRGNIAVPMTSNAKALYRTYKLLAREKYSNYCETIFNSDKKRKIVTLIKDIDRKTLKVAVLLAVFNHGETNFEVTSADLIQAKAFVTRNYKSAVSFFEERADKRVFKILAYIQDKKEVSSRDLYDEGFFPKVRRDGFQAEIYEEMIERVQGFASTRKLKLAVHKVGKQDRWRLVKLTKKPINQ